MIKNPLARRLVLEELEKIYGKKIVFVDMDGVIADFKGLATEHAKHLGITTQEFLDKNMYRKPGFYFDIKPSPGAIDAVRKLMEKYEVILVSAPSWNCVSSFSEKRAWVAEHFGSEIKKRMDLSFHKGLYMGHYLIDDRTKYGAGDFIGEYIMFGNEEFSDWDAVLKYLL